MNGEKAHSSLFRGFLITQISFSSLEIDLCYYIFSFHRCEHFEGAENVCSSFFISRSAILEIGRCAIALKLITWHVKFNNCDEWAHTSIGTTDCRSFNSIISARRAENCKSNHFDCPQSAKNAITITEKVASLAANASGERPGRGAISR